MGSLRLVSAVRSTRLKLSSFLSIHGGGSSMGKVDLHCVTSSTPAFRKDSIFIGIGVWGCAELAGRDALSGNGGRKSSLTSVLEILGCERFQEDVGRSMWDRWTVDKKAGR